MEIFAYVDVNLKDEEPQRVIIVERLTILSYKRSERLRDTTILNIALIQNACDGNRLSILHDCLGRLRFVTILLL